MPPKEVIIMDVEGQRLDGLIGPYDEDSNLLVICEAEGGKNECFCCLNFCFDLWNTWFDSNINSLWFCSHELIYYEFFCFKLMIWNPKSKSITEWTTV